jgi:hypothetical protein
MLATIEDTERSFEFQYGDYSTLESLRILQTIRGRRRNDYNPRTKINVPSLQNGRCPLQSNPRNEGGVGGREGCDGFLASSTESDPRTPAISLRRDSPEEYTNMWQKVLSIGSSLQCTLSVGGNDLFVMPVNLKTYLASLTAKDESDPKTKEYFAGGRFSIGDLIRAVGSTIQYRMGDIDGKTAAHWIIM